MPDHRVVIVDESDRMSVSEMWNPPQQRKFGQIWNLASLHNPVRLINSQSLVNDCVDTLFFQSFVDLDLG